MNCFCAPAWAKRRQATFQDSTKVEFVLNLRTAKALNLVWPASAEIE
jgi:hypothetical protein